MSLSQTVNYNANAKCSNDITAASVSIFVVDPVDAAYGPASADAPAIVLVYRDPNAPAAPCSTASSPTPKALATISSTSLLKRQRTPPLHAGVEQWFKGTMGVCGSCCVTYAAVAQSLEE